MRNEQCCSVDSGSTSVGSALLSGRLMNSESVVEWVVLCRCCVVGGSSEEMEESVWSLRVVCESIEVWYVRCVGSVSGVLHETVPVRNAVC